MSELKIRFLGSGDAFGSGGRFQPCILVEAQEECFLLDCGASSLIAMKRVGVSVSQIDAILLSHLHGDHFGGVPFFLLDAQLVSKRTKPLVVAGPPGLTTRLPAAMEALFPGSSGLQWRFPFEVVELAEGKPASLGRLVVTPFRVVHDSGAPPYAFRIESGGKTVAYSGDTQWTESLVDAARGADLFICEVYAYEKKVKFHVDFKTLMEHRERLGCRRLVLTHMSEEMLDKAGELGVECAEDGKEIVL
jgi:ribonuclease BN (tRNA processing enzyme)